MTDALRAGNENKSKNIMRSVKEKITSSHILKRPRATSTRRKHLDFSLPPKEKKTSEVGELKNKSGLSMNMAALFVISIVTGDAILSFPNSLKNSGNNCRTR
ncbi:hypothetical protein NPIL_176021 [Nephila pilipes]|uniref:Uncharacterized protein n=1 Tax=Nephila pilipes TaxID=299642 RepID=A0A8X6PA41_NEPPI|nr:hypothetical protein NPIL_176021 [Nephila pilipes]